MITKEQLQEWKSMGYSISEMAEAAGMAEKTVEAYLKKYGLTRKKTRITDQEKEQFCRMRGEGLSTEEIAAVTGHSITAINKALKAAGLIPDRKAEEADETVESLMFTPHAVTYAEPREKKVFRTILGGKAWIDVTDLEIPG